MALRNTFLEVREIEGEAMHRRRSQSAPPCGRSDLVAQDVVSMDQIAHLNILLAGMVPSGPAAAEDPVQVPPPRVRRSRPGGAQEDEGSTAKCAGAGAAAATSSRSSHGSCRLCFDVSSPAGCKLGCKGREVSERPTGPRGRPCKGKRDRVKKALAMVEARIEQNPEVFTAGGFFLPATVERDPRARARVLAQWSQVAAKSGRPNAQ